MWLICTVFCFLAASTYAFPSAEGTCGKRPPGSRVVGGQNAQVHSWPWQISLRVNGQHICGGSLIAKQYVLTAAHCVQSNPTPSRYTVVVGAHRMGGKTSVQETLRIAELHKHSGFTSQKLRHDVALLKLERPVKLSAKIMPACITSTPPSPGTKCFITGWGRTSGGGPLPDILQQAVLPVVSTNECREKYGKFIDASAHLCAGSGRASASGGCNGDSGGPLACERSGKWYLHGVVSFGRSNCPTTHYTVFARVTSYIKWIMDKMGSDGGIKPPTPNPGTNYKLIGCFKDKGGRKKRAIPFLKKFKASNAIAECAKAASSKGYRAFAVQRRRRCYTGPNAHKTYDKYGKAPESDCINGKGGRKRNSVYLFGSQPPPPPPTTSPPKPPNPGSCGMKYQGRIVGGEAAARGEWPWQAMLRTSSGFPYCGGTLVAPQWVVTASHCVEGSSARSVFVRMGAQKRVSTVGDEQDFSVVKVIMHPSYNRPIRIAHDIALLKLNKPATLNKYVNLACLPNSVPAPTDGTKCWITGWGRLSSGGATPDDLQQVSVPVASRARCDKAYPGQLHDSMICAGVDQGGIDTCQGDSGGPMVCESGGKFYLQGATSWGAGCAAKGKFGVYAKVKYLLRWVNMEISRN